MRITTLRAAGNNRMTSKTAMTHRSSDDAFPNHFSRQLRGPVVKPTTCDARPSDHSNGRLHCRLGRPLRFHDFVNLLVAFDFTLREESVPARRYANTKLTKAIGKPQRKT